MRTIKFRIWARGFKPPQFVEADRLEMYSNTWGEFLDKMNSDSLFIWQQFTGLLDKNGKEIFEGDILCLHDNPPPYTKGNSFVKVVYIGSGFCYEDLHNKKVESISYIIGESTVDEIAEVVGNIFENPELLNAKE